MELNLDISRINPFSVYVENKEGEDSPYSVREEAVLRALGALAEHATVTCHDMKTPDLYRLSQADYFIGAGFQTGRLQQHGASLRMVHCLSAGVEKYLPLDWLPPQAVLTNSSGAHAEKGGAFGAMVALMLCEGVPRHVENQKRHRWDGRLTPGLSSRTITIVGLGALGGAIAKRLRPFGPRVLGVSRSGRDDPLADAMFSVDRLDEALRQTDCLVVCCPLTRETRGLIGARQLRSLKEGAAVFNIARGPIVDNDALCEALGSGHLSGAALDAFEVEPLLPESPLWDVPNLMIFPHSSCDDPLNYVESCLEVFGENVRRDIYGSPLVNVVNRDLGY